MCSRFKKWTANAFRLALAAFLLGGIVWTLSFVVRVAMKDEPPVASADASPAGGADAGATPAFRAQEHRSSSAAEDEAIAVRAPAESVARPKSPPPPSVPVSPSVPVLPSASALAPEAPRAAPVPAVRPAPPARVKTLALANRTIRLDERLRAFPSNFTSVATARGTAAYVLMGEVDAMPYMRERVEKAGARLVSFLPKNGLLVEADAGALEKLAADVLFAGAWPLEPADKIQRGLPAAGDTNRVPVAVFALAAGDVPVVRAALGAAGAGKPSAGTSVSRRIDAWADGPCVRTLAARADVLWIERRDVP